MEGFPGWRTDPTGRHQERWFDSAGVPTVLVRNDGYESTDEGRAASGVATAGKPTPEGETGPTMKSWAEPSTVNADTYTRLRLVSRYTASATSEDTLHPPESIEAVPPPGSPPVTRRKLQLVAYSFRLCARRSIDRGERCCGRAAQRGGQVDEGLQHGGEGLSR
jgi:hypothetical protein